MIKLDRKERHFLLLLAEAPGATIAIGTSTGKRLMGMRLVYEAKWGRYGITPAGAEAIRAYQPKQARMF